MKERIRESIQPIYVKPGDVLEVAETITDGTEHILLVDPVERNIKVEEIVTFDIEEGDFTGATGGIGVALLEKNKGGKK